MTTLARITDPETSHRAAAQFDATKLGRLHLEFESMLKQMGQATSNEVAAAIAPTDFARRNTLRRRASDLHACGRIVAVGARVCSVSHRSATLYEVAKPSP